MLDDMEAFNLVAHVIIVTHNEIWMLFLELIKGGLVELILLSLLIHLFLQLSHLFSKGL